MAHDEQRWLTPRLLKAATLCNQTPAACDSPLWLGVDLGTCDVVSMVVDSDGEPVAVCLDLLCGKSRQILLCFFFFNSWRVGVGG